MARGLFRVEGMGRLLALHAADDYREHGAAVTLSVGEGARQPGLTFSLSPRWGAPATASDALWQDQLFHQSSAGAPGARRDQEARARLDSAKPTPRPSALVPDDRDQDRQARDDGRTWTQHRAWTDQDRAGIQRLTKDTPAPREPRQDRDRKREAVAVVALYRAVSYTDLSDTHFDGHPYATRRAVNHLVRAGLIEEHEATGPEGHRFTVLTATDLGRDAGYVPEQQAWTGLVKPAELSHDTAVYRAATAAKVAAAHDLGLHVVNHDQVMYPDAQFDIEDADGVSGPALLHLLRRVEPEVGMAGPAP